MRSLQLTAVSLAVAVAMFTGPLIAGGASPANAGVRPPTPIISVSGNGRPAIALRTVLNRLHRTGNGQFTLATAGLSNRERSADSAFVADLNKAERQAAALDLASSNLAGATEAIPAAGQGTVITIVPGTTLTISSTGIVLDVSPQDVTDIENAAGLGSAIASLVGAILAAANVNEGSAIAAIVASALAVGSDALKLCAGNDGGSLILSVTVPAGGGLPSASACGISI